MSTTLQKTVFFIPFWIKNIVERNHLSLKSILDLNILSDVASSEDLAMIALLNNCSEKYFGFSISDCSALFFNWHKSNESQQKYFNHVEPLFSLVEQDLCARLFLVEAKEDRYSNAFEIQDIDQGVVLVTIYPGYFGGEENQTIQNNLIRDLVKLFYAHEGYDDMAKRQIFQQYIHRL